MNPTAATPKPVLSSPSEAESHSLEGQSSLESGESTSTRTFLSTIADRSLEDQHESRIHALRQQLDYINNTDWMFENNDKPFEHLEKESDDTLQDDERFLEEQLLLTMTDSSNNEIVNCIPEEKTVEGNKFFEKSGIVTFLEETYGLIDGALYFSIDCVQFPQLAVNDEVRYLAYRLKEIDDLKISKVLCKKDNWLDDDRNWFEQNLEENDNIHAEGEIATHGIVAKVISKIERTVVIEPGNVSFSLNEVASTFLPAVGDFIQVTTKQQWLDDAPCGRQAGVILEVESIAPVVRKTTMGTVTHWQGDMTNGIGEIDKKIFFSGEVCSKGYLPKIGDNVSAEAIESEQGPLCWRALLVVPQLDPSKEIIPQNPLQPVSSGETHGITITEITDQNTLELGTTKEIKLKIENTSEKSVLLVCMRFLSKMRDSQLALMHPDKDKHIQLTPRQSTIYTFHCKPKFLGVTFENVIFIFKNCRITHRFILNVTNSNCSTAQDITTDKWMYNRRNKPIDNYKGLVGGTRPVKPPHFIRVPLGMFPIPKKLQKIVFDNCSDKSRDAFIRVCDDLEDLIPSLSVNLSFENYREKWHSLIYLEEIENMVRMSEYHMEKAFLTRKEDYLCLEIKGLAERRPSLMIGDYVRASDPWDTKQPGYQGIIHHVKSNGIWMKFHPDFHTKYVGQDASFDFFMSRTTYRKCHQAINLAVSKLGNNFLFSNCVSEKPLQVNVEQNIKFYNPKLNDIQKSAVFNILKGVARPLPYVIFGPPGTGKTVTVIETILQIVSQMPSSRILVATPSNSSANLVTERLVETEVVPPGILIRIIAHYLTTGDYLPDLIKPYCATIELGEEASLESKMYNTADGINMSCSKTFIGRHRITIATCVALGNLAQVGLPNGHFTHVIIDEAGQATEPEIMIALSFVDPNEGQIILAGDPMQLGPVTISRYASHYGLQESFLERLMERFPYKHDKSGFASGYDPRLVTRLEYNYRSTPEVIKFCSKTFYSNALRPQLSSDEGWPAALLNNITETFTDLQRVRGIVFHGIRGANYRNEESPSWFNPQEAAMVLVFVSKLYKAGLTPDDVGIITPYILQVKKIRSLFLSMGLEAPKVGSVEEFQGQERKVILLSTVRSTDDYVLFDRKYLLGFVNNPKRMNVSLSRAQVLTVIFGNPHVLASDRLWKEVIRYSVDNDTYLGCDLPEGFEYCNADE